MDVENLCKSRNRRGRFYADRNASAVPEASAQQSGAL